MKKFGQYMLKIATFTTVLTFVGLLLLNAGWISPQPMSGGSDTGSYTHAATYHGYLDVYDHHGKKVFHRDHEEYSWFIP